MEVCRTVRPRFDTLPSGQKVECHLYSEGVATITEPVQKAKEHV